MSEKLDHIRRVKDAFKRIGMYCPSTKHGMIGFIDGIEFAVMDRCITAQMETLLTKRYRFKKVATGWPGLVEKYAIKYEVEWETAMCRIVEEL